MAGVTRDINYKLNFVPGTMGGIAAGISGLNQFVDLSNEFFRGLGGINVIDASLVGLAATLASVQLQATQAFAEFDEGLASVKAISQELTGNMETISNAANQFSIQFGKDITEITEGLETLGRAGLTGLDNQLNTLQEGFNLSKIEGMELNSALETLVQTTTLLGGNMNDLDFSSDVQTVNDLLVGTSMAGPLEVSDVAMTLKYAGGTAATAGANLEDTDMLEDLMGTIAVFAQRGVVGDPAGTALRAFLTNPAGQNSTTVEGLEKIGLSPANLWEESGEKMLPISEQIRKINNAMEQLDLTQQEKIEVWSDIVGSKLGQQMLKLDADDIDQATTNIREQASAQEIAEQSLDNLNAKFASLEQAAQSAWREFGEAGAKVIGPIIEGLTKILEILSNPVFATGLSMLITAVTTNAIGKGIPLARRLAARVKDSYNQYSAFYAQEGDEIAGGDPAEDKKKQYGGQSGQSFGAKTVQIGATNVDIVAKTVYLSGNIVGKGFGSGGSSGDLSGGSDKQSKTNKKGKLIFNSAYEPTTDEEKNTILAQLEKKDKEEQEYKDKVLRSMKRDDDRLEKELNREAILEDKRRRQEEEKASKTKSTMLSDEELDSYNEFMDKWRGDKDKDNQYDNTPSKNNKQSSDNIKTYYSNMQKTFKENQDTFNKYLNQYIRELGLKTDDVLSKNPITGNKHVTKHGSYSPSLTDPLYAKARELAANRLIQDTFRRIDAMNHDYYNDYKSMSNIGFLDKPLTKNEIDTLISGKPLIDLDNLKTDEILRRLDSMNHDYYTNYKAMSGIQFLNHPLTLNDVNRRAEAKQYDFYKGGPDGVAYRSFRKFFELNPNDIRRRIEATDPRYNVYGLNTYLSMNKFVALEKHMNDISRRMEAMRGDYLTNNMLAVGASPLLNTSSIDESIKQMNAIRQRGTMQMFWDSFTQTTNQYKKAQDQAKSASIGSMKPLWNTLFSDINNYQKAKKQAAAVSTTPIATTNNGIFSGLTNRIGSWWNNPVNQYDRSYLMNSWMNGGMWGQMKQMSAAANGGKVVGGLTGALSGLASFFGPVEVGLMAVQGAMALYDSALKAHQEALAEAANQLEESRSKYDESISNLETSFRESNPNATDEDVENYITEKEAGMYDLTTATMEKGEDAYVDVSHYDANTYALYENTLALRENTQKYIKEQNDRFFGIEGMFTEAWHSILTAFNYDKPSEATPEQYHEQMEEGDYSSMGITTGILDSNIKDLEGVTDEGKIVMQIGRANDQAVEKNTMAIETAATKQQAALDGSTNAVYELTDELRNTQTTLADTFGYEEGSTKREAFADALGLQSSDARTNPFSYMNPDQTRVYQATIGSMSFSQSQRIGNAMSTHGDEFTRLSARSVLRDRQNNTVRKTGEAIDPNTGLRTGGKKKGTPVYDAKTHNEIKALANKTDLSYTEVLLGMQLAQLQSMNNIAMNQMLPQMVSQVQLAMTGNATLASGNSINSSTASSTAATNANAAAIAAMLGAEVFQIINENYETLHDGRSIIEDLNEKGYTGDVAETLDALGQQYLLNMTDGSYDQWKANLESGKITGEDFVQSMMKYGTQNLAENIENAYYEQADQIANTGSAGGAGSGYGGDSGSGSDSDSDKDESNKKNYVDLVICNKKTIPKLNVNLFKKEPTFKIQNQNLKLRDIKINTQDKPKAISSAVKNAIIDVQERTNPKIIQDQEAEYNPVEATEGTSGTDVPTGTTQTS